MAETMLRNKPVTAEKLNKDTKKEWEKPTFEDVSERVMAQPYIRFT